MSVNRTHSRGSIRLQINAHTFIHMVQLIIIFKAISFQTVTNRKK